MSDFINHPQVEVLSAADGVRRRHWSDEDKLRIVEESYLGHRQGAATARRHGICRSLLTIWRRQYRSGELGAARRTSFSPVTVTPGLEGFQSGRIVPTDLSRDGQVEIVLLNGRRLLVSVGIDPGGLARMLSAVDGQ